MVVGPTRPPAVEDIEESLLGVHFAVIEITIHLVVGEVEAGIVAHMTHVVIHHLGQEVPGVIAETRLCQVVAGVVVIGQHLVDGIDDGVYQFHHIRLRAGVEQDTFVFGSA